MATKIRPDIRALTRLVPPSGNLVQGQSELAIDPRLARAASEVIAASLNHYGSSEGVRELREAVAKKVAREDEVLRGAPGKLRGALAGGRRA